jgi:predicted protein tyrosine phosphatase
MNLLFVCNQGKNRSRTAAELFNGRFRTDSAGLYCDNPVAEQQLIWADAILVMEDQHRREIARRFPAVYLHKRILTLGIPDVYRCNQPELMDALKSRIANLNP